MKGVHWIDLGPWPVGLALIPDKRAYGRFLRSYTSKPPEKPFPPTDGASIIDLQHPDGTAIMVIAVGRQTNRDELAGSLAHEATHAMRWIMEWCGEKEPGTEAQAYLVGYIVKRGLAALKS